MVACIPHLMPVYRKVRGQPSTIRSYEQRASKTKSWSAQNADSIARARPPSTIIYGPGRRQYSGSEPDKEAKDSDDEDLLPRHGIGVKTHLETRVETVTYTHCDKDHQGRTEGIPMQDM